MRLSLNSTMMALLSLFPDKDLLFNHDHTTAGLHGDPTIGPPGGPHRVDMLEIPGKGRCYVYFARYTYDPLQQSLNDNPQSELYVTAGDYILVWGEADEDGFFEGELLDGRKGLVPSNLVEKLTGEDLLEFHQSVVLGINEEDVWSTAVPNNLPLDFGGNVTTPERDEPSMPYHCKYSRFS